jgi:Protein of unknown function (DUF1566)
VSRLEWDLQLSDWIPPPEAMTRCDGLTLAQQSDWRLPSILELVSSMDYGRSDPAIDSQAFPDVGPEAIWAADPRVSEANGQWYVAFNDASVGGNPNDVGHRSFCARGPAMTGALEALPEVVKDPRTSLVWQRQLQDQQLDWLQALDYCSAVAQAGLGGYTDWRLPSIKELFTTVDPTKSDPAIDTTLFPGSNPYGVWSSTPSVVDPSQAFRIHYSSGFADKVPTTDSMWVRCVRGP